MFTRIKCTRTAFAVAAVFFLILLACSMWFAVSFADAILKDQVDEQVRLEKGTIQWERFEELPFALQYKVYFFEVQNGDEIINEGAKPIVKEKGPFVYKQFRKKTILSTNDSEDTVTYEQNYNFTFDPEASNGLSEDDNVTILNPAMISILNVASDMQKYLLKDCILKMFEEPFDKLFITAPVSKLMFTGFEFARSDDPACMLQSWIVQLKSEKMRNTRDIIKNGTKQLGQIFSFFSFKTEGPDGKYTVQRGIKDIGHLGNILRWNDKTKLDFWGSANSTDESCNQVHGTDSTLYPPRISDQSVFQIFNTDICRTVAISYTKTNTYKGVEGKQFETNENTLRATDPNVPEHDCYCTKETKDVDEQPSCYLDGVIDMRPCFGAPVLFSFPHFLWADPHYANMVEGLKADEDLHKILLLVEPLSGTPLQGMKRVQLNMVMSPQKYIPIFSKLSKAVMPVLWIDEGVSLPQTYVDELNDKLFDKLILLDAAKYTLIAISALGFFATGGYWIWLKFYSIRG